MLFLMVQLHPFHGRLYGPIDPPSNPPGVSGAKSIEKKISIRAGGTLMMMIMITWIQGRS